MYQYRYIGAVIFLLLMISYVNAEEKIIKTELDEIRLETWLDETSNTTKYKLHIGTENMEGEDDFEKTGEGNLTDENFTIRFIRSMECNTTMESLLLDYFEECEIGTEKKACKEAYLTCESQKTYFENLSSYGLQFTDCEKRYGILSTQLEVMRVEKYYDANITNITVSGLIEERDRANSTRIWVGIIVGIIIVFIYEMKRRVSTREERELGVRPNIGKAWDAIQNLLHRGPKEPKPGE